MKITAAQLYYICKVYPEEVTHEEAIDVYKEYLKSKHDEHGYWEFAANIINKLTKED